MVVVVVEMALVVIVVVIVVVVVLVSGQLLFVSAQASVTLTWQEVEGDFVVRIASVAERSRERSQ